ncbi:MAG: porin family protein [Balneolia bacterium]|nr:porin family protein [Balneolia bacterium]
MKKVLSIAVLFALAMMFSTSANAQNAEGDIVAGGGLGFGFDIEEIGLNLNGYYSITDEIRAGADILYYFVDGDGVSFWELNLLGNYLFINDEELRVYALAGIHRFNVSVDTGFGSFGGSQTGLMIGGGVEYDLGAVSLYGEPRISLVSAWGQLSLTAGVRYKF